jgi:hypothetical protein
MWQQKVGKLQDRHSSVTIKRVIREGVRDHPSVWAASRQVIHLLQSAHCVRSKGLLRRPHDPSTRAVRCRCFHQIPRCIGKAGAAQSCSRNSGIEKEVVEPLPVGKYIEHWNARHSVRLPSQDTFRLVLDLGLTHIRGFLEEDQQGLRHRHMVQILNARRTKKETTCQTRT